jgi:hypothetical protein
MDGAMKDEELQAEFQRLRQLLFPDWDSEEKWRLCAADLPKAQRGFCDHECHSINIGSAVTTKEEVIITIVHEICHALAPPGGHDVPWRSEMTKAATRARENGQLRLARDIDDEARLGGYKFSDLKGNCIFALERDPLLPYDKFVKCICEATGMADKDIRESYPRLERFYRQKQRQKQMYGRKRTGRKAH